MPAAMSRTNSVDAAVTGAAAAPRSGGSDAQSRRVERAEATPGSGSDPAAASDPALAEVAPALAAEPLNGQWNDQPTMSSALPVQSVVDSADLLDEPPANRMLEVEDLFERPVEVVGDVRDLLEELVGRVRHDSPGASPDRSTVNWCWQAGHETSACVCPSWFTRRYRSCRNARSDANRPSITPFVTWGSVPSRVITRPSSTTVRYASFSRTRGSRSGRISSRAVASRMTPSRWTVPLSST